MIYTTQEIKNYSEKLKNKFNSFDNTGINIFIYDYITKSKYQIVKNKTVNMDDLYGIILNAPNSYLVSTPFDNEYFVDSLDDISEMVEYMVQNVDSFSTFKDSEDVWDNNDVIFMDEEDIIDPKTSKYR